MAPQKGINFFVFKLMLTSVDLDFWIGSVTFLHSVGVSLFCSNLVKLDELEKHIYNDSVDSLWG